MFLEWRWVKSFLIIVFLGLNCFLGYKVYQRNHVFVVNSDTITSINSIFSTRNIKCDFDIDKVEIQNYMKKISITNSENLEASFIYRESLEGKQKEYIGRNREILPLPIILTNFLRDTKFENITIKNVILGYYPELSQIDKTVLSGEAIPAWLILLENDEEYIYNAYLGEKMQ